MRLVRAAAAASSGNGDPSCWAKWCTRKYAPSAPASSAATASSIDCSRASAPERTRECGEADQCPKERNPIFFTFNQLGTGERHSGLATAFDLNIGNAGGTVLLVSTLVPGGMVVAP